MDYYGLLFLYYLKGLSGKSVLKLFFNIEAGGTEQLLPENTSTPTTTPILADIQYPDGLRTDQYFTYRETPTTISNKARIKTIKGNTLKWNQLQSNNTSRTNAGITYTYDNGKLTVTGTATSTSWWLYSGLPEMNMKANHKYLIVLGNSVADSSLTTYNWYLPNSGQRFYTDKTIIAINNDVNQYLQLQVFKDYTIDAVFYPQVFDLTQMFGVGNEPSTVEDFTSLFPLSYYSYNQGSLLSFNGNGIKTTGKNLIEGRGTGNIYNGGNLIPVRQGDEFWIYADYTTIGTTNMWCGIFSSQGETNKGAYIADMGYFASGSVKKLTASKDGYIGFCYGSGVSDYTVNKTMLSFASFTPSEYEAYTSSTLSLPISTYFPTGMKRVNAYDELTPSKATTRIGAVTFNGSENWAYDSNNRLFQCIVSGAIITNATTQYNVYTKNNRFDDKSWATRSDGSLGMYYGASFIFIKSTQFADVNALKTWLQSNPVTVCYELATPTETPITTEDANEALSLLMGKSVSSSNANQMINIITKGE